MIGVPNKFNTKQDALYCVDLALKGDLDRQAVKKKLENLLSDEYVWQFKSTVNATYQPTESEKVIENVAEDGTVEHLCYELVENPNARFLKMGFTKQEILDLISQLGG